MHTPASIARHPIHPMLVTIPIGLWLFSFACDLIRLLGGASPNWEIVALYSMIGGVAGALLAAIPGLIDLLSLPPGIRRIALIHMTINLSVVALFVLNAWMRTQGADGGPADTALPGTGQGDCRRWAGDGGALPIRRRRDRSRAGTRSGGAEAYFT